MRLDVDLGFDAVPGRAFDASAAKPLDLHTLAGALRTPGRLSELLRDQRYDEVRVREGALPLSAVQAAVLLTLAMVRTRRFVLGHRVLGRGGFLLYAIIRAALAAPREFARSLELALRVKRVARRRYRLPAAAVKPSGALYLRVDPTLKWHGIQVGGAATHTTGVINGLIDNGLEVEVLAPERPVDTERATFNEVPVRRVLQLVRGLTYADYSDAMLAATRSSADFVYQRHQLGAYAGLELARRLSVPLVLEFNGSEIWLERHWGSGSLRFSALLEQLEQRNLQDASLVVVVSEALRQQLLDQGVQPERVIVVPNGVDVTALEPYRRMAPAEWRRRLGLREAPTVGFIGTFGLWHGVKLLPALIAAVPDTRWVLVGDGGLLPEVRAEITRRGLDERTLLTGVLEHAKALEMLAGCDVCVSPHVPNPDGTPFFGSPTKLFEYMGLGKPIVASNLDQIGEVIEHERSGLLCPPGDVDAAAAAVKRLLADDHLRERLGQAALERAAGEFSWAAHTRKILARLAAGAPTTNDPPLLASAHERSR